MIEDPADGAMLDAQFGSRSGNLYKPEGPGADWATFSAEGFAKKTNEKDADFTDVVKAIDAVHAPRRSPCTWRARLEANCDVDLFLRWLAVNTVIENWDAYGAMAHNYFLYGDPRERGRLRWIPWDNSMAFGGAPGMRGGPPGFFRGGRGPAPDARVSRGVPRFAPPPGAQPMFGRPGMNDILLTEVSDRWPLIRTLLDDDVYAPRYRQYLEHALGGRYAPEAIEPRIRQLQALIAASTSGGFSGPSRSATDGTGTDGLIARIRERRRAVRAALDGAVQP